MTASWPAGPRARVGSTSYRYRSGRRGVEEVDLEIFAGDVLALIGPNGSGKSTLLRLLAGDLVPTRGEVHVFGRPAHRLSPADRARVGVGVDEPAHADALTGRENALFFARANGLTGTGAAGRVHALLTTLGLATDADAEAGAYSFGMRRKLQLVETLVHEPELVLLDEPTVGLDADALPALRALLETRAAHGAAVVVATNDLHGGVTAATRIVFLHEGRKVADAPPAELLGRVHGPTRLDVTLEGPPERPIVFPQGTSGATYDGGCRIESAAGTAILPAVCQALVTAGARVRGISVREPDLTDVFRALTGVDLTPVQPGAPVHQPAYAGRLRRGFRKQEAR